MRYLLFMLLLSGNASRAHDFPTFHSRSVIQDVDTMKQLFVERGGVTALPALDTRHVKALEERLQESPRLYCTSDGGLTSLHVRTVQELKEGRISRDSWKIIEGKATAEYEGAQRTLHPSDCKRVAYRYPLTEAGKRALLHLGAVAMDTGRFHVATLYFDKVLSDYPGVCDSTPSICRMNELAKTMADRSTKKLDLDRRLSKIKWSDALTVSDETSELFFLFTLTGTAKLKNQFPGSEFFNHPCQVLNGFLYREGPLHDLASLDPQTRALGARKLGDLGELAMPAVSHLLGEAKGPDPVGAIVGLSNLKQAAAQSIPVLRGIVSKERENTGVRAFAASALTNLGDAEWVVQYVVENAKFYEKGSPSASLTFLRKLAKRDLSPDLTPEQTNRLVQTLRNLAERDDEEIRDFALDLLSMMGRLK